MNKSIRWGLGGSLLALALAGGYTYYNNSQSTPSTQAGGGGKATGTSGTSGAPSAGAAGGQGAAGAAGAAGAGSASPPVSVSTVKALQKDVPVLLDMTGAVSALSTVDIRSQVASVVTGVHVKEGQFVKRGELLFTLDARADQANVQKAQAQLLRDQATLADAERQLARSKELVQKKFISQASLDTNQANVDSQRAALASDQAAIDAAKVSVSFSRINAPSSGRIGALNVFVGSFVQPTATALPLVTLTQIDPIAVSFNLPQRNLPDALQLLKSGGEVTALLPDKPNHPLKGKLQFVDSSVDANSGTVKAKAVFGNGAQALWPGAFVNVRMTIQTLKDAVVVPQAAIVQNPRGKVVFVMDAQNKAQSKPVEIVYAQGLDAAVSGIAVGERIVVDGRQNVRPGATLVERVRGENKGDKPKGDGKGDAKVEGKPAEVKPAEAAIPAAPTASTAPTATPKSAP